MTPEELISDLDPVLGTNVLPDGYLPPTPTEIVQAVQAEYDIVRKSTTATEDRLELRDALVTYFEPHLGKTITLANVTALANYLVQNLEGDRFFIINNTDLRDRNTIEIPLGMAQTILDMVVFFEQLNAILNLPLGTAREILKDKIATARNR